VILVHFCSLWVILARYGWFWLVMG